MTPEEQQATFLCTSELGVPIDRELVTKFDPSQPRFPKGFPEGGRWVDMQVMRYPDPEGHEGSEYVEIKLKDNLGSIGAHIQHHDAEIHGQEKLQIIHSGLNAAVGYGIGVRMYAKLADYAHEQGWILTSDVQVSAQAQRIYEALKRRGYKVERSDKVTIESDGTAYGGSYPVYTVTKFDPDQPRAPAGSSIGGQWVSGAVDVMGIAHPDTPEFKRWFGESIVVDEHGDPLPMFHGTQAEFGAFDIEAGAKTGIVDRMVGPHFAYDPRIANTFTRDPFKPTEVIPGTRLLPVYLQVTHPWTIEQGEPRQFEDAGQAYQSFETDQTAIARDVAQVVFSEDKALFQEWFADERVNGGYWKHLSIAEARERAGGVWDLLNSGQPIPRSLVDTDGQEVVHYPDSVSRLIDPTIDHEGRPVKQPFGHFVKGWANFGVAFTSERLAIQQRVVNRYKEILKDRGYDALSYRNTAPMETRGDYTLEEMTGSRWSDYPESSRLYFSTHTLIPFNAEQIKSVFNPRPSWHVDFMKGVLKFDPNQPRAPAGTPEGGQWVQQEMFGTPQPLNVDRGPGRWIEDAVEEFGRLHETVPPLVKPFDPKLDPRIRLNRARMAATQEVFDEAVIRQGEEINAEIALDNLRRLMSEVRIKVNRETLDIIEDLVMEGDEFSNRMKTQFETNTSSGYFGHSLRAEIEDMLFGIDPDPSSRPQDRPVYGALVHPLDVGGGDGAIQYGKFQVYLKDEVKARTTWTGFDSLYRDEERQPVPSPVNDPQPYSLVATSVVYTPSTYLDRLVNATQMKNVNEWSSYVEAQIHGGVTREDIAHINFPPEYREVAASRHWETPRPDATFLGFYGDTGKEDVQRAIRIFDTLDKLGITYDFRDSTSQIGKDDETATDRPG